MDFKDFKDEFNQYYNLVKDIIYQFTDDHSNQQQHIGLVLDLKEDFLLPNLESIVYTNELIENINLILNTPQVF